MKTYTIGLYEKAMPSSLNWKEKLSAAKAANYDYVEISIDETPEKLARLDMPKEERLELVQTMYEVGVPIRTMCLSGHRKYPLGSNDPATLARGLEIMEKAILLADDLGIRMIMLAGYDVYYEESTPETQARFAENLRKAVMMAAAYGIRLDFETMETDFLNTVWKAMFHIKKINSAFLGVYPDSGNIMNAAVSYHSDVYEDLKSSKGHITSLHLKETVPGKFREIPYGTGHVNFEKMIETAWDLGVRMYVTECWYVGNEKWQEELCETNATMRTILERMQSEN
jgi:hexulose-6-phosphate isomerase, putative